MGGGGTGQTGRWPPCWSESWCWKSSRNLKKCMALIILKTLFCTFFSFKIFQPWKFAPSLHVLCPPPPPNKIQATPCSDEADDMNPQACRREMECRGFAAVITLPEIISSDQETHVPLGVGQDVKFVEMWGRGRRGEKRLPAYPPPHSANRGRNIAAKDDTLFSFSYWFMKHF